MMKSTLLFRDSVLSFLISRQPDPRYEESQWLVQDQFYISFTPATRRLFSQKGEMGICIVGCCVDSEGVYEPDEIPDFLLAEAGAGAQPFAQVLKRMAGIYTVILLTKQDIVLFPDASASLSVYYAVSDGIQAAGSCERHVGEVLGRDLPVEQMPTANLTLPGDRTIYHSVKILLPNHFVGFSSGQAVRVPLRRHKKAMDEIVEDTIRHVDHVFQAYRKQYAFAGPLTGGYDSRLNLAFCKRGGALQDMTFYTILHTIFGKNDVDDIDIPQQIARGEQLRYLQIEDYQVQPSDYDALLSCLRNMIRCFKRISSSCCAFP